MKSKTKLILLLLLPLLLLIIVPHFTIAEESGDYGLVGCKNECTLGKLVLVVIRLVNLLFSLASVICMLFIVWGAWGMITAEGNQEKIQSAKDTFSDAVIGFFLVMVTYILLSTILLILSGKNLQDYIKLIPNTL